MQRQCRPLPTLEPSQPQGQGRVAFFIPFTKLTRTIGKDRTGPPVTIGEHIRAARRRRRLLQREVAGLIGVTTETVANWEKGKSKPPIQLMPTVTRFLGFDPSPSQDSSLGARMAAYRRQHGFPIKEAAKRAGVDPDSWSTWERTGTIPTKRGRERLERVLDRGDG